MVEIETTKRGDVRRQDIVSKNEKFYKGRQKKPKSENKKKIEKLNQWFKQLKNR